ASASLRETWTASVLERTEEFLHPARREAGRRHLAALLRRLRPTREELRFLDALAKRISRDLPPRANP
ncbi:MAG TPA: hypothetical protein VN931_00545, partial [Fibrobacteria bacterium]|nr:hypothetical protein [Fibrobacteria bacterium]